MFGTKQGREASCPFYQRITQGSIDGLSKFYEDNSHVDVQLSKEMRACLLAEEKIRIQNTEVITILLDVARKLARQSFAFRGDGDGTDGNFHQIALLVSRHNPSLKHWLQSKDMKQFRTTYMSQNEFIQLL
jgi:hypothetical protein